MSKLVLAIVVVLGIAVFLWSPWRGNSRGGHIERRSGQSAVEVHARPTMTARESSTSQAKGLSEVAARLGQSMEDEQEAVREAVAANQRAAMKPLHTAGDPVPPQYRAYKDNNRRYKIDVLGPRVRSCWAAVQGKGKIRVGFYFERKGDEWVAAPHPGSDSYADVVESSLPEEEDEVALACLNQAAQGTSFPWVPLTADEDTDSQVMFQSFLSPESILEEREAQGYGVSEPAAE